MMVVNHQVILGQMLLQVMLCGTYTSAPSGTGIDTTGNEITLDVVAATGSSITLGAGRYWLVVATSVDEDATRWNWYQGAASR